MNFTIRPLLPQQTGVPSGTGLPCPAAVTGIDLNEPGLCLLGVVYRFVKTENGVRYFEAGAPVGVAGTEYRRTIPESQIVLYTDMPIDGWPEPGNVAP